VRDLNVGTVKEVAAKEEEIPPVPTVTVDVSVTGDVETVRRFLAILVSESLHGHIAPVSETTYQYVRPRSQTTGVLAVVGAVAVVVSVLFLGELERHWLTNNGVAGVTIVTGLVVYLAVVLASLRDEASTVIVVKPQDGGTLVRFRGNLDGDVDVLIRNLRAMPEVGS